MTERESKLLIVGDNVRILQPIIHVGTVMETADAGVRIEWDDGQDGWLDHRGMTTIEADVDSAEMRRRSTRRTKRAINVLQAMILTDNERMLLSPT
jgi:hypothetical protein